MASRLVASTSRAAINSVPPCCRASATTRRARLSSSSVVANAAESASSGYKPPLRPGQMAVYDEALAYIAKDREDKLTRIEKLNGQLQKAQSSDERRHLQDNLERLTLASEINDPEIRWRARNGKSDMSRTVFRYLAEEAWRREGTLGVLMQRVTQMSVVPDLLPIIDPDVDLQIHLDAGVLEPGSHIKPSQTLQPPTLKVQIFHPEEKLYTLLMLDPDSPNPDSDTFDTKLHWAVCNLPLSSVTNQIDPSKGKVLQDYIPPHPQKGTPYHRYTFILFEQRAEIPGGAAVEKGNFEHRSFVQARALRPVGVNFFRQVWDGTVSQIYKDTLNEPEVVFGRPRRRDRKRR